MCIPHSYVCGHLFSQSSTKKIAKIKFFVLPTHGRKESHIFSQKKKRRRMIMKKKEGIVWGIEPSSFDFTVQHLTSKPRCLCSLSQRQSNRVIHVTYPRHRFLQCLVEINLMIHVFLCQSCKETHVNVGMDEMHISPILNEFHIHILNSTIAVNRKSSE